VNLLFKARGIEVFYTHSVVNVLKMKGESTTLTRIDEITLTQGAVILSETIIPTLPDELIYRIKLFDMMKFGVTLIKLHWTTAENMLKYWDQSYNLSILGNYFSRWQY
jgi:hypothetical protein